MLYRLVPLCLAIAAFVALSARADDKPSSKNTHEGQFVSAKGDSFKMTDKAGKEHTHMLADDAKVMCDGKMCKLADLKKGTMVKVTTKPDDQTTVVRVEARTKAAASDKTGDLERAKERFKRQGGGDQKKND
jgi:hypothetical protein